MTIYALSSGPGVAGVAIIRVSGKYTSEVIKLLTGKDFIPAIGDVRGRIESNLEKAGLYV